MGGKKKKKVPPPPVITLQNADSRLANFAKYYKGINMLPEDEWKEFFNILLTPTPIAFRITSDHRKCCWPFDSSADAQSQARILRDYMLRTFPAKMKVTEIRGEDVGLKSFSWYPNEFGWQVNIHAADLNKNATLREFAQFLNSEMIGFHIVREEVPMMVCPLLMDIQPQHKVLDMHTGSGLMAAKIAEQLYSDPTQPPEGFLVVNDKKNGKLHFPWIHSSNVVFMSRDPKTLPDLYMDRHHTPENRVLYDRILCDVPSSSDGLFRNEVSLRTTWSVADSLIHHKEHKTMLKRGLDLLEVGGQLLYRTCTMSPVENEAVVCAILKEAPGVLELVDVRDRVPGFYARPGMDTWRVMSNGLVFYNTKEVAPEWFTKENDDSIFPPAADEVAMYNLDRCMRVLPHNNDTSAFFCAMFTKYGELPWHEEEMEEEEPAQVDAGGAGDKGGGMDGGVEKPGAEDKEDVKVMYKPNVQVLLDICVADMEVTTEVTDHDLNTTMTTETFTFDKPELTIAPSFIKKTKKERIDALYVKEFLEDDDEEWLTIKEFFKLSDDLDATCILRKGKRARPSYYYVHPNVKKLITANCVDESTDHLLKNYGLKLFNYIHNDGQEWISITRTQGVLGIWNYLGNRIVEVTKDDYLKLMLDKKVLIKDLSAPVKKTLELTDPGCVIFHYKPDMTSEPNCDLTVVGYHNKEIAKDALGEYKLRSPHAFRMFGLEPPDQQQKQFNESVHMKDTLTMPEKDILTWAFQEEDF